MNKSLITNLLSTLIIIVGYIYQENYPFIIITGVFALSGSLTNWLAIHMLFEKVPLLYGSGVILDKFEDIKLGIKNLILQELFTETQINNFLLDNKVTTSETIINKIDFDKVFIGLVEAIEGSQLGGMLAMVGGRKALDPLKEPFTKKLKIIKLIGLVVSLTFVASLFFVLFRLIIFLEKPTDVIVNEDFFELVISPPDNFILKNFCSSEIALEINLRFFLLK